MRVRAILSLCCFLALFLVGAVLFAEPTPAAPTAAPVLDTAGVAAVCPMTPVAVKTTTPSFGGGPVTDSACPVALWQQCYQRYGTCMLCFCLGSACECENRCV